MFERPESQRVSISADYGSPPSVLARARVGSVESLWRPRGVYFIRLFALEGSHERNAIADEMLPERGVAAALGVGVREPDGTGSARTAGFGPA